MGTAEKINSNFLHHSTYLQSLTNGMKVVKEEGFSYSDSGLCCDTFNIIYITDGIRFDKKSFEKALQYFDSNALDYCVWINEENLSEKVKQLLQKHGLAEAASDPGMAIDLKAYQTMPYKGQIIKLDDASKLEKFAEVLALNWQPADQNVIEFYWRVREAIFSKVHSIEYYGSYVDNRIVSVIEVFPTDKEVAGFYSLCTLANYRGKGIATDLMKYCLNKLKKDGYSMVTLQASDEGLGIYKKLGFVEQTRFYEYKKNG